MKRKLSAIILLLLLLFTFKSYSQLQTLSGRKLNVEDLDKYIRKQMDSLAMPGLSFALINKGKVVYHRSYGVTNVETKLKVDDQSIFEAASMSKTVFAYFVLRMVDKKLLELDTPLYRYMAYKDIEKDERYKLITARMVLSHTTGFPNWRYFDKRDESLYKYGELYLKFTPGTQFAYSGEGYRYLSLVVAHLNGLSIQTLDPLFQKEVAKPLHMKHTWFSGNDYISIHKVQGHVNGKMTKKAWPTSFPEQDSTWLDAAGGLHTEALDFSAFLIGLMKGKGLSKSILNEMFKQQVVLDKTTPHYVVNGDTGWGLGIAIKPVTYGTIYEHGGNNGDFQSGFKINKANQNGYVFFTNCEQGVAFNNRIAELLIK
ncbi:serine hydrolase [Pedobacter sp. HMWF019]|uniref:serine hydrolase domain-containing protein n=1 Tax=Pedobacter sp. HMWF019 TaxID=2056856 RepID=UPI000D3C67C9|nr:serine hydrolase domain-containing protein [Pedobacter sp. HMWF019]PTS94259.1 serine hydrolase [Pedobacter sp. HMWF019]